MDCNTSMRNPLNGNSILMLKLISESSERGWIGITKLQKLSFLVEYHLSQQGKRAFGHRFFMWEHGPISKGIYNDLESLLNEEIVFENEKGIQASEAGANLAEQFADTIPSDIQAVMQSVIKRFAHWSTISLENFVHNMKVTLPNGKVARIDDLGRDCTILEESPKSFKIERNVLETFSILANESLRETIRMTRKHGSKSSPYQPLVP